MNLTSSEEFNDANARLKIAPDGTKTAELYGLFVIYDAPSNTYFVGDRYVDPATRPYGAFSPAEVVQSTPEVTVFQRVNGAVTDRLTLSKPGTSGTLNYTYVGAGLWQRTTAESTGTTRQTDAFVYGVDTPQSAAYPTGTGSYSLDLIGTASLASGSFDIRGTGKLGIDFGKQTIDIGGNAQLIDPMTGSPTTAPSSRFFGTGILQGPRQGGYLLSFETSGAFSLYDSVGAFSGGFFGPDFDEVGATFALSGDGAIVGSLLGRRDAPQTGDIDLGHILSPVISAPLGIYARTSPTSTSVRYEPVVPGQGNDSIVYNPLSGSYDLRTAGPGATLSQVRLGDVSNRKASESDSRYTVYESIAADGSARTKLTVYNNGAGNDLLPLYYTSFAVYSSQSGGPDNMSSTSSVTAFGLYTNNASMPRTGTAAYQGLLHGYATTGAPNSLNTIGGTADFSMDFAAKSFTGGLHPVMSTQAGSIDFGRTAITSGRLDLPDNATQGFPAFEGMVGTHGEIRGNFYGPNAQEIGGRFTMQATDPALAGVTYQIGGVVVGKTP